jgi:hypothetical protein
MVSPPRRTIGDLLPWTSRLYGTCGCGSLRTYPGLSSPRTFRLRGFPTAMTACPFRALWTMFQIQAPLRLSPSEFCSLAEGRPHLWGFLLSCRFSSVGALAPTQPRAFRAFLSRRGPHSSTALLTRLGAVPLLGFPPLRFSPACPLVPFGRARSSFALRFGISPFGDLPNLCPGVFLARGCMGLTWRPETPGVDCLTHRPNRWIRRQTLVYRFTTLTPAFTGGRGSAFHVCRSGPTGAVPVSAVGEPPMSEGQVNPFPITKRS